MTDLNDYYWFALVVEHGGYSAAERATNIPKSKLSRHIHQLEERLGVRLIQRTSRQFAVTEIGMQVFQHAMNMRQEAHAIEDVIQHLQAEPRGNLRISTPVSIAQQELAQHLPEFMRRFPHIKIQLVISNRRVDVIGENVDLALRVRTQLDTDQNLIIRRFSQVEHYLVASQAYLNQFGTPQVPEELSQHATLNMYVDEIDSFWVLQHAEQRKRIKIQPKFMGSDLSLLTQLAIQDQGIALLPKSFIQEALDQGQLVYVLPEWHTAEGIFHAVYPSKRGMLPALRVFIDYLVEKMTIHD